MTDAPKKMGRPKGSKNRSQIEFERAQKLIEEKFGIIGFHPLTVPMSMAADESLDPALRLQAAAKALPYLLPTMKSVELTGEGGGPIQTADVTEQAADIAKLFGVSTADVLKAAGRDVVEDEDEEAEEVIDDDRAAIAAEKRAAHQIVAEEARIAREAAKDAAKRQGGRKAEDVDDVDDILDLSKAV